MNIEGEAELRYPSDDAARKTFIEGAEWARKIALATVGAWAGKHKDGYYDEAQDDIYAIMRNLG